MFSVELSYENKNEIKFYLMLKSIFITESLSVVNLVGIDYISILNPCWLETVLVGVKLWRKE